MNDIEKVLEGRKVVEAYQERHADFGKGKLGKTTHADLGLELAQGLEQVGLTMESLAALESQHYLELVPYSNLRGEKFRMTVSTDPNRPQGQATARFYAVRQAISEGASPYTIQFSTAPRPTLTVSKTTALESATVCQIGPVKTRLDAAKCEELGITVNVNPTSAMNFGSLTAKGDYAFQLICPGVKHRTMQYILMALLERLGLTPAIGASPTEIAVNGKVIASLSSSKGEKVDRGSTLIHSAFDYSVASAVFQVPIEEIRKTTTSLQEELGEIPSVFIATDTLKRIFTEDFAAEVTEGSYSDYELSLAAAEMEKTVPEV